MSTPDQTTHRPFAVNARDDAVPAWSPADEPTRHGLLERGRNCDAIRHADRFTTLVDGAAYFPTLRAALRRARHTVFILGWDVDSRMQLAPDGADDGCPTRSPRSCTRSRPPGTTCASTCSHGTSR
jgi:phosphatidylserine/phosphatidylglycerophosphate/cardiolipin synthase-like enzyme